MNIDEMMKQIRPIYEATEKVVDNIEDGQRKQIKDIAEAVAVTISMEAKKALPFVNHFVHSTKKGYVSRGKHGGFIKGQKVIKMVKPAKVVPVAPVDSNIDLSQQAE